MFEFVHHGPFSAIIVITSCYVIFAIQMLMQTPRNVWRNKGPRAVMVLVLVFVLCAISGYASSMFPVEWQLARNLMHYALAAAAVWLVVSNQSAFIARMMIRDDD